jgi:hypothetical protein
MSDQATPPDAGTEDTTDDTAQPDAAQDDAEHQGDDGKPFDREYVEKLRKESQGYRERAKVAESALFEARVAATGRLADPTDLPFSGELVDDSDALTAAIDALLAAKPHLASRKPAWGDVGAGQTKAGDGGPSFADLFRGS